MPRLSFGGHWFQSNAAGMTILGSITAVRGLSYTPWLVNPNRDPAHWLEGVLPPTYWAWVWIIAGLVALLSVYCERIMPAALGLVVGLHAAWGLSFIGGTLAGDTPRGWVSGLGYIGIVLIVLWAFSRGKREEIRIREGV